MIVVAIQLRRCTRCGHLECPCCRDWCDECVADDTPCDEMECLYAEVPDFDGYARLDAAIDGLNHPAITALADGSGVEIRTPHRMRR